MKIQIENPVVTFFPETKEETDSLEQLWRTLIGCSSPTLKLCPIGEYVPSIGEKCAQFLIEDTANHEQPPSAPRYRRQVEYKEVRVNGDSDVYCGTCNDTIKLKDGDPIPLCCGKLMEIID